MPLFVPPVSVPGGSPRILVPNSDTSGSQQSQSQLSQTADFIGQNSSLESQSQSQSQSHGRSQLGLQAPIDRAECATSESSGASDDDAYHHNSLFSEDSDEDEFSADGVSAHAHVDKRSAERNVAGLPDAEVEVVDEQQDTDEGAEEQDHISNSDADNRGHESDANAEEDQMDSPYTSDASQDNDSEVEELGVPQVGQVENHRDDKSEEKTPNTTTRGYRHPAPNTPESLFGHWSLDSTVSADPDRGYQRSLPSSPSVQHLARMTQSRYSQVGDFVAHEPDAWAAPSFQRKADIGQHHRSSLKSTGFTSRGELPQQSEPASTQPGQSSRSHALNRRSSTRRNPAPEPHTPRFASERHEVDHFHAKSDAKTKAKGATGLRLGRAQEVSDALHSTPNPSIRSHPAHPAKALTGDSDHFSRMSASQSKGNTTNAPSKRRRSSVEPSGNGKKHKSEGTSAELPQQGLASQTKLMGFTVYFHSIDLKEPLLSWERVQRILLMSGRHRTFDRRGGLQ